MAVLAPDPGDVDTMLRKSFFYLIMFGFVFLILEGLGYLAYRLVDVDDFNDHRAGVLERLDGNTLAAFLQTGGDPRLGWENRGPKTYHEDNCLGVARKYTVDVTGARIYTSYDSKSVEIIIVGDSYTQGAESDDAHTYPAQLADILGISVANHGVGGYGPVQSFINLKKKIQRYPQTKVVILGIMYENLYRMMNSYRPVLYEKALDYGLKPYMAHAQIQPHPGPEAFENVDSFSKYAVSAFENDFWAKPAAGFPYSLSLVRALSSNYFYFRKLQKQFRRLGIPEYFLAFQSEQISVQLVNLMNRFAQHALGMGLQPVVVFIPRNRYDTQSASEFVAKNQDRFNANLLIGDVGSADMDWKEFNLEEEGNDNICHPSPYGYRMIAEYIADLLKANEALTR